MTLTAHAPERDPELNHGGSSAMHFTHHAYLALEIARERTLEAEARHRYAEALAQAGPGLARRSFARAAAGVSRASASIARRLDEASIETEGLGQRSTGS